MTPLKGKSPVADKANDHFDPRTAGLQVQSVAQLDGLEVDGSVDVERIQTSMRQLGASPAQVASLDTGRVSLDDYVAAAGRAVECVEGTGIEAFVMPVEINPTTGVPSYVFSYSATAEGLTEAQIFGIAESCQTYEMIFVETIYQLQARPPADEIRRLSAESFRLYLACLERNGIDTLGVNADSLSEHDYPSLYGLSQQSTEGLQCAEEAGLNDF